MLEYSSCLKEKIECILSLDVVFGINYELLGFILFEMQCLKWKGNDIIFNESGWNTLKSLFSLTNITLEIEKTKRNGIQQPFVKVGQCIPLVNEILTKILKEKRE